MRLLEMGGSSSTQPTNPTPAHDTSSHGTSSTGAKAFQTAMYAAKGATSFAAPTSSQSPGRPIPPGGAYGNAASGQSLGQGGPPPGPGWLRPTDWSAHSPPGSSHTGTDPFNVIISGDSNVTLPQLEKGLEQVAYPSGEPRLPTAAGGPCPSPPPGVQNIQQWCEQQDKPPQWQPVPTSNSLINPGTGPELANVQPWSLFSNKAALYTQPGEQQQQLSMRVGGTSTEFGSDINHFRLYQQQPVQGDNQSAYFIAASEESFNPHFGEFNGSFPWIADPYHDVVSFDQGRDDLVDDIRTAGDMQGWNVEVSQYHGSAGRGSNGVPYNGVVDVVTLLHE
jgi:hypothetical protein